MPQVDLVATIAVYVVLALLLLSLNIFSLWKWWVKALAIVVTTICIIVAYFSIAALIGWPSPQALPSRFSVVATRVVEPDRISGAPGHVYLWVEELNAHAVPITAPRGYQLPFTPALANDADTAQKKINSGKKVMGQARSTQPEGGVKAKANKTGAQSGRMTGKIGKGDQPTGVSTAAETIGNAQTIVFSNLPAVELPDKANGLAPPG